MIDKKPASNYNSQMMSNDSFVQAVQIKEASNVCQHSFPFSYSIFHRNGYAEITLHSNALLNIFGTGLLEIIDISLKTNLKSMESF